MLGSTAQTDLPSGFFVVGGTLRHDAPSYIARLADQELYEGLLQGQFCYVLTARQMGKSSLMIRTAARLREAGIGVAVLDLTAVGRNLSVEQWYGGMLMQLGQRLDLENELIEFWQTQPLIGPLQRWLKAIEEIVLPRYQGRLVIFIDEIDAVRSLLFSADEFFAGIRQCYNQRGEVPGMEQLTFCLLGVAAPIDLIRDTRLTPFNIGRRIELHDFTVVEAAPLARGLQRDAQRGAELLKRILYWTGGHPYLTQRLCQAVAKDGSVKHGAGVDRLCAELFFTRRAHERDDNLLFVRERMLRSEADLASLLDLYRRVRSGRSVRDEETNPLVSSLHLSGICSAEKGRLKVRNRVYAQVFDRKWVAANMPDAEIQRQRAAYRRGVWRTATISALILVLVGSLALTAIYQRDRAEQQAEANRQLLYYTQMRLAQEGTESSNVSRTEELLQITIPQPGQKDLRSFEWYLLWWLTHREALRVNEKHIVSAVAFSPDGKHLAIGQPQRVSTSGNNEYLLKLYDLGSGQETHSFRIPAGTNFNLIVFSPDWQHVVVNAPDHSATLWNLHSGRQEAIFIGHKHPLSSIAFSSDGSKLVTADMAGVVKLWNTETGKERLTLTKQPSLIRWCSFSPNGRQLATADESQSVKLWDADTGQMLPPVTSNEDMLSAAVFFPDGRRLLTAAINGNMQIWDLSTRRKLTTLSGHSGYIQSIAFSPDGKILATGNYDRTVKLWNISTGQEMTTIKGHGSAVLAVSWSPDGKRLVTGSADNSVKIWNVADQLEPILPAERITRYLATSVSSTSNNILALGVTINKQVKLWNLSTGKEVTRLNEIGDNLLCAAFSPDGKLLATGGMDALVKHWDTTTGQMIKELRGHVSYVYSVVFSPDRKQLISGGNDQALKVWDVATGQELDSLKSKVDNSYRAVFSPDGKLLASACRDGSVLLWNLSTRQVLLTFKKHTATVKAIAFSPDNRTVATGGEDISVRIWDTLTGQELKNLGQVDGVQRIAYSPDGKRLVTGSISGTIKLWDSTTGQELMTLKGHTDEVTSVTFSADGKALITSGNDGTLRLWRAAP